MELKDRILSRIQLIKEETGSDDVVIIVGQKEWLAFIYADKGRTPTNTNTIMGYPYIRLRTLSALEVMCATTYKEMLSQYKDEIVRSLDRVETLMERV